MINNSHMLHRLLTGSILAHEMMHAWLRLKGEHLFQDKHIFQTNPLSLQYTTSLELRLLDACQVTLI